MTDDTTIDLDASRAEANRLLAEAGWAPHPLWGSYAKGTLVAGLQPDGQAFHVKDWAMIQPGHPKYGPDTPDTAEEAAAWLVARFGAPLDQGGELGESAGDGREQIPSGENLGADGEPSAESDAIDGDAFLGGRSLANPVGADSAGDDVGSANAAGSVVDADFSELPALEGQDVAEEPTDAGGGVAYFGDNLHVIRLAKIGRVTQVASEKKAALQFGWDVAEFAYLTNLIVRMDQGLAPDDANARGRFALISDASRAMSAVDAFAETQVAYLNAASREDVEAFDPEAGWP